MHDVERPDDRPRGHRLLLVGGLFLLAPVIGEFLFGNEPITVVAGDPPAGAPVRRRRPAGPRGIASCRARVAHDDAFSRSPTGCSRRARSTRCCGTPQYGGFDHRVGLPGYGTCPWLGTSVQLLQHVVSPHTVWSISCRSPWSRRSTAIATPSRGRTPRSSRSSRRSSSVGSTFLAFVHIEGDGFAASVSPSTPEPPSPSSPWSWRRSSSAAARFPESRPPPRARGWSVRWRSS